MDLSSKWGVDTDNVHSLIGDQAILKIACVQFITVSLIFSILRPSFIMFRRSPMTSNEIDFMKLVLTSSLFVIGTYIIPIALR